MESASKRDTTNPHHMSFTVERVAFLSNLNLGQDTRAGKEHSRRVVAYKFPRFFLFTATPVSERKQTHINTVQVCSRSLDFPC